MKTENPMTNALGRRICGSNKRGGGTCESTAVMANGRCHLHGGKTPSGPASAAYIHGRYSKVMPARMRETFEHALNDPDALSFRRDLALIDARIEDLLGRVDTGESGATWQVLQATYARFTKARGRGDTTAMTEALADLDDVITKGRSDAATWGEIRHTIQERRTLAEGERKRLIDQQQMITAEQAIGFVVTVQETIRRILHKHLERAQAQAIMVEIGAEFRRIQEQRGA